jgi:hypothetical protein
MLMPTRKRLMFAVHRLAQLERRVEIAQTVRDEELLDLG